MENEFSIMRKLNQILEVFTLKVEIIIFNKFELEIKLKLNHLDINIYIFS